MYQHTDYWKFTEDLDFLSFDIYPAYSIKGTDDAFIPAITLERCRAMTGGFIVPEQHGVLLAIARTATKNRDNQVIIQTPPGLLSGLFGVKVEELGSVTYPWPPSPAPPVNPLYQIQLTPGSALESQTPSSRAFEILSLHGARAVGTWITPPESGPTAATGQPAITVNRFGKGHAIYVGTHLTAANASCVIGLALQYASIPPLAEAPANVEIVRRRKPGTSFLFVLNHYPQKEQARLFASGTDLITGNHCKGSIELAPYGVVVIQEER